MNDGALTLTMQDVADLARVRRPVVSMWRQRPMVHGELMPFPSAVLRVGGIERFDRVQIVDWLERTGRGNNTEQRYDAPALAAPDGVEVSDVITLLCWHVMTGQELERSTQDSRVDAAVEVDPDDRFLLREIRAARPSASVLRFVDDLVEASYGAPDALSRLEGGRLKRQLGVRDLTPELFAVVHSLVQAVSAHSADGSMSLDSSFPLSVAMTEERTRLVSTSDEPAERELRRRASIHGVELILEGVSPQLRVCSVVGLDDAVALDRVDEVLVELAPDEVAVVLGPASALTDVLRGDSEKNRSETLRPGNLTLALRLPRGLWREAPRQSLAVWVLRGGAAIRAPRVADLSGLAVRDIDLGDLAADAVGAFDQNEARTFRYARRIEIATVLAGGPVVPRGARAPRIGMVEPASHADQVHAATMTTSRPLRPLDVDVATAPGAVLTKQRSLAELRTAKQLDVKRGSRVTSTHADAVGTVAVLPEEVSGGLRLDPLDAAALYPRATRTEPGDVIFVEKPSPRAWVDDHGGSLVASPARVLRIGPTAGLGPHVLAAVINVLAPPGTDWETWNVPDFPPQEVDRLEEALIASDRFETEALERVNAAAALKKTLIRGVAAGALTIRQFASVTNDKQEN